jgi:hypothetical protein
MRGNHYKSSDHISKHSYIYMHTVYVYYLFSHKIYFNGSFHIIKYPTHNNINVKYHYS